MLTAANEKTKMIQELVATAHGELLSVERPAEVAFVDHLTPMPLTGPCKCLGVIVFADEYYPANIRVMDGGIGAPIMEAFANSAWWGSFMLPRGVASVGNLVVSITQTNAYGYVYYLPE